MSSLIEIGFAWLSPAMRLRTAATSIALVISLAVCTFAQTTSPPNSDSNKEATSGNVFKIGGGVTAPRPIYQPPPEYSKEARKKKYQGTCILVLVVDTDGRPQDIRVNHVLGLGLDEQAIKAVKQWKFEPALKDGHPVAVQINVEVSFKLY
jgi:TonB family protein